MLRLILGVAPAELPRLSEVQLTGTAVAFALGLAALLALVFGLLPLAGARFDLAMLRDSGRGLTWSRTRMAARRALVTAQMALAVVLLSSTGLMVRTYQNLRAVQPGFDPSGVLTMEIALPEMRYNREPIVASAFFEHLANRLRGLPGTANVGFSEDLPLLSGDGCTGVTLEGPTPEQATGACPPVSLISPGYFETMGIQVAGRTPDWAGMNAGDGAMVVSRAFADHWWPDENPIGKGLRFNGTRPPFYRVVGVADDVRGNGLDAPPTELVYFPMRPIPGAPLWTSPTYMHLVLRTEMSNPVALTSSVTRIVEELEPQAAVANVQSMETVVAKSIARRSFTMVLLAITAVLALFLSAVGIYGVISYIVTQRRGEIGVRIALGARVKQVTQMVLRESVTLAILGVLIGVVASIATTRVLAALLFGVAPTDTATLVLVPVLLIAVALLASYAPARRAARINPVEALRTE